MFDYDREEHEATVRAWRRARLARLTAPDGWLSLVARVPLEEGETRVGAAEGCAVALPPGAPAVAGVLRRAGHEVTWVPEGGGAAGAGEIRVRTDRGGARSDRIAVGGTGGVTIEVTDRESGMFVRVRDPENPARRDFAGIEAYEVDPKWRVVAKLERYTPEEVVELDYEAGTTQRYVSPGAAVFEVDGVPCRVVVVYEDDQRKQLYLVFWDPTARDTTYGAGRFLYAPLPVGDRVLLDFNLAFSPPCAFTEYAACPVAPRGNRLGVRVEAGEKRGR